MKPKTIILMVVAIVCGLAASYMTSRLLADRNTKEQPVATVKVLISKKKVPAYEVIKNPEQYFEEKDVPEGSYPAKCLKSFDEIRGQKLGKAKSEEEAVFKDDILTASSSGIIANLPEGQRAMAIRVNPETLVGGFVLPGSRVDVIATFANGTGEVTAETIMQNVLVLAVDMIINREDKQAMLGSTVTFAVKPEEAMRLSVASRATDIRLVLRSPADKGKNVYPPAKMGDWRRPEHDDATLVGSGGDSSDGTTGSLLGKVKKPEVEVVAVMPQQDEGPAAEPPPAPQVTHTLTIISGEYESKAVYVKKDNGEWARGSAEQPAPDEGSKPTAPWKAPNGGQTNPGSK
jgi:pilus assembly protein CpaB